MPFGKKAVGQRNHCAVGIFAPKKLETPGEKAFAKECRDYKFTPELHMAVRGDAVWPHLVRERNWWRRTSLCEHVGHCAVTPVSFLPMPGDVRVCVHTPVFGFNEVTAAVLLEFGDWFEDEMGFVRRLMTPESCTIDIGANHGCFCLTMAKLAPAGQSWAFEPSTTTCDLLETSRNANELQNLTICRAAVSDATGTATFVLADQGSEYNHLVLGEGAGEHPSPGSRTEQVRLTTLDECMKAYSWQRIDFIKIDAEGAELQIIKGGKEFFDKLSPLVMFEAEHAGENAGVPVASAFMALGYRLYRYVPGLGALVSLAEDSIDSRAASKSDLNLFACKDDFADELARRGLLCREASEGADLSSPLRSDHALSELMASLPDESDLYALPYAAALKQAWTDVPEEEREQRRALETAIALFLRSRDGTRGLPERYTALSEGYERLRSLCAVAPKRLRPASLARVSRSLFCRVPMKDQMLFLTAVSEMSKQAR
jgi:FkbM family methyltransferase